MEIALLSLAALVAGFVDAIAGGGGVVTFPVFLYLGLPVSQIVGTNKLVSTAGTAVAVVTYIRKRLIQKELVLPALPFAFVGSLIGAVLVLRLPNDFLKPLVSILIVAVALYCFFRPSLGIEHKYDGISKRRLLLLLLSMLLIGAYDGFFGPGTGIFMTFFFVRVIGCDFLRSTANIKVINWTSNLASLLYFLTQGNIRFDLGVPMLLANMAGGYLGANTAIQKGSGFVKWIYIVMAAATALKLLLDLI